MADRWGPDGPPEAAYSRVTRDLAQVTAAFSSYLDALPGALTAAYDCRLRPLTTEEAERVARRVTPVAETYAVEPADPGSATVLVARWTHEGGAGATIGFGRAAVEPVPGCFCDACDEESDGLVEQVQRLVDAATAGVTEFRRQYVPRRPDEILYDGPWLEEGYGDPRGPLSGHASGEVRGELFETTWQAWIRRDVGYR